MNDEITLQDVHVALKSEWSSKADMYLKGKVWVMLVALLSIFVRAFVRWVDHVTNS